MLALAGIVVVVASFFANQTVNCQIYRPSRCVQKTVYCLKSLNLPCTLLVPKNLDQATGWLDLRGSGPYVI
jgi:hypothetical protein